MSKIEKYMQLHVWDDEAKRRVGMFAPGLPSKPGPNANHRAKAFYKSAYDCLADGGVGGAHARVTLWRAWDEFYGEFPDMKPRDYQACTF